MRTAKITAIIHPSATSVSHQFVTPPKNSSKNSDAPQFAVERPKDVLEVGFEVGMKKHRFTVRFWGTRGSVPVSGPKYRRYGGNTACIELICDESHLVFDAGSGLYPAGEALIAANVHEVDLLFTHSHYDHIIGLPFFAPLFDPNTRITFWSGHLSGHMSTREIFSQYLRRPWFPVVPDNSRGRLTFRDFKPGDVLTPREGILIKTCRLRHIDGCIGYRVEWGGRAVALIYDYEHSAEGPDATVLQLTRDAALVVYDCTYTEEEMPRRLGYGHSTWQQGVKLAKAANIGRLALFHHEPSRSDDELDIIERNAKEAFANAVAVHDGQILDV